MTTVDGESPQPFTLAQVGNPDWWRCPRCLSLDVNSIYRECELYGFRCVARKQCGYVWHYGKETTNANVD